MFSKNKVTAETLAVMKEKDPEGYAAMMDAVKGEVVHDENVELAAAKATIAASAATNERASLDARITQYGAGLKVEEIAKTAITGKLDFNAALLAMADAAIVDIKNVSESTEETGSEAAGEGSDTLEEGPKTFAAALKFVRARDGIKGEALIDKVNTEFPGLQEANYETAEE